MSETEVSKFSYDSRFVLALKEWTLSSHLSAVKYFIFGFELKEERIVKTTQHNNEIII